MYPREHQSADRGRETGTAAPLIEKIKAARELSSCCVGVEALLETENDSRVAAARDRSGTKRGPAGCIFLGLVCGVLASYVWASVSPPTEHRGIKAETLGKVAPHSVSAQVGVEGYQLLLRRITIDPGGQIARHSHAKSPGLVYIESGTWVEGREDGEKHYSAGETLVEDKDTVHWFYNRGNEAAAAIVCDIKPVN